MSSKKSFRDYQLATKKDIKFINNNYNILHLSAKNYLKYFSERKIIYTYNENKNIKILEVNFYKNNWMHVTGIRPVYIKYVNDVAEQFLEDMAQGKPMPTDIYVSRSYRQKIKILNDLPNILKAESLIFTQLLSIQKYNRLKISDALTNNKINLLLGVRNKKNELLPVSLMEMNKGMYSDISTHQKQILTVISKTKGNLELLSYNSSIISEKDANDIFNNLKVQNIFPPHLP